jgi:hypothetical protein
MSVEFITETSPEWQTCWRCKSIGIETPTIAPNAEHVVTVFEGVRQTDKSCLDCYNRMIDEVMGAQE